MYRYYSIGNRSFDTHIFNPYIDTHCADFVSCSKNLEYNSKNSLDTAENPQSLYHRPETRFNHPNLLQDYIDNFTKQDLPILFNLQYENVVSIDTDVIESIFRLKTAPTIPSTYFPIATRYITASGYIFVERPPFQVDIDYKIGRAPSTTKKRLNDLKVWIPWTIFIFNPSNPHSFRLYFSSSSLTDMDHKYVVPFLPNTYPNGEICFSNSLSQIPQDSLVDSSNISLTYSLIFNDYFNGGWNSDLTNSWAYVNSMIYKIISQEGFDYFSNKYPNLVRLFYPSYDDIEPIISKNKIIANYYQSSLNGRTDHSIFSYLDTTQFHYLLLFLLSKFDLSDMLDLITEVEDMPSYSHDSDSFTSRPFSHIVDYHNKAVYTSNNYVSSSHNLHTCLGSLYSKIAETRQDSLKFPSNFLNTHLLTYNVPTYNNYVFNNIKNSKLITDHNFIFRNTLSNPIISSLYHKIILDTKSGLNTSSRIYIYDYEDPYSITSIIPSVSIQDFYMALVKNNYDYKSISTFDTVATL